MKTNEIKRQDWPKLCQRLNEVSRGAMLNIQRVGADGITEVIAEKLPLRSIALDESRDPCNDELIIEAGLDDQKPVRYVIVEPIHVRLKNGVNDRYNRIEIQAENGLTVISFNPGIIPFQVDPFAPDPT